MNVAAAAFGIFAVAFLLHWLWWRVRVPRRQTAALLGLFLLVLVVGLALLNFFPALAPLGPWGFWTSTQIALFHIAMTLAYIVAYSALEERSPSMTLLVFVAESRGAGRSRTELDAVLAGFTPVETRLAAMARDGMITIDGERCTITPKGRAWAVTFGSWHRLIRFEKGG